MHGNQFVSLRVICMGFLPFAFILILMQSLPDNYESLRPSLDLPQNNIVLKNNNNVKELMRVNADVFFVGEND